MVTGLETSDAVVTQRLSERYYLWYRQRDPILFTFDYSLRWIYTRRRF